MDPWRLVHGQQQRDCGANRLFVAAWDKVMNLDRYELA
jgi:catalase (peroxidase I)